MIFLNTTICFDAFFRYFIHFIICFFFTFPQNFYSLEWKAKEKKIQSSFKLVQGSKHHHIIYKRLSWTMSKNVHQMIRVMMCLEVSQSVYCFKPWWAYASHQVSKSVSWSLSVAIIAARPVTTHPPTRMHETISSIPVGGRAVTGGYAIIACDLLRPNNLVRLTFIKMCSWDAETQQIIDFLKPNLSFSTTKEEFFCPQVKYLKLASWSFFPFLLSCCDIFIDYHSVPNRQTGPSI